MLNGEGVPSRMCGVEVTRVTVVFVCCIHCS